MSCQHGNWPPCEYCDEIETNVAHATAAKDAEIEALRAEVEKWRSTAVFGACGLSDHLTAMEERATAAEARAERLAEACDRLIAKWERQADEHGVRQFTGNDHKLFANELRAAIDQARGKGEQPGETM